MNIFAAIKKAINSNLNKPLDVTLGEIQTSVNNVRKASRKVVEMVGIPYNTTTNEQVLTNDDEPIFSVNGSGRILQIVPITNQGAADRYGTVLLNIDGDIVINNRVNYAGSASDRAGNYIADTFLESGTNSIYTDCFASGGSVYASRMRSLRANVDTYSNRTTGVFDPNGIPFNKKFELRLTQAILTDTSKVGVIVVYELYE